MKKWISAGAAAKILVVGLGLFVLFHVMLITRMVSAEVVWGGGLSENQPFFVMLEIVAILAMLFILIILIKCDYLKLYVFKKMSYIGVWIIFAFFILNTLGNLVSGSLREKLIFTPITLIFALLSCRLAVEK